MFRSLTVPESRLVARLRGPESVSDLAAETRTALAQPYEFPPLRRALTDDDRVTVVVDETLEAAETMLVPVIEAVRQVGIPASHITLLTETPAAADTWAARMRRDFAGLKHEAHDPADRDRLAYLATTKGGKRLYLNRTLVDADQAVVVTGVRYDAALGHGGGEADIYPRFADDAARNDPPAKASAASKATHEAVWLLGQPFFVQAIPAADGGVSRVICGAAEALAEGRRLLDAGWRRTLPSRADLVVASVCGTPGYARLAAAISAAAAVVTPAGRVVLAFNGTPEATAGFDVIARAEDVPSALSALERKPTAETLAARLWARAVSSARVSLWGDVNEAEAEELGVSAIDAGGVTRLAAQSASCVVVEDADGWSLTAG